MITLTAADAIGQSSFNSGLYWSNGLPPSAGNGYQVSINQLRTPPDGGTHTFGGDSLTINTGGILMYKGTGTTGSITVNNLIANGGSVIDHRNGSGDICNLYGSISVLADSVMYAKQGPINIYSIISGSGKITNPDSDGAGRTLTFYSPSNTYIGSIVNNGRFALADDAVLNFIIGASGVNNSITGTGAETIFRGDFSFDLTGAGTSVGDSWVIANTSSQIFSDTFTVVGFTDVDGILWMKSANGVNYQFSESTGILSVVGEQPKAGNPTPANGATVTTNSTLLTWNPGDYASDVNGHHIYFGSDFNDVNEGIGDTDKGFTTEPNYYVSSLTSGATYFWRVDEVNEPYIWKGDIWSFRIILSYPQNIIIFNDNGGWCWYQDERAIINDNKLIIGSVADASGTGGGTRDGNVEVATFDLMTSSLSRFVLSPNLNSDDHAAPAFMVRPDGRILAVYCKHGNDSLVRYRITTNPGDTTSWGMEQTFNVNSNYGATYSHLYRLSSTGITYDFYRGQDYNPNVLYSTNDGASWGIAGRLIRTSAGTRPYTKFASNNTDRIYFTYTDGHPRDVITNLYCAYLQNGIIYNSFGTQIGILNTTDSSGIAPSAGTRIFNADSTHRAWGSDMHLDAQGRPVVAYSVRIGTVDIYNDHRYRYARWTGTQWNDYEIAYAGQCLYTAENDYTGLITINPSDPNIVYISTNADPVTGAPLISETDGYRHFEIFKGQTDDFGASWIWTPITMNSTLDNIRPIVPIDTQHPQPLTVLIWLRGLYSTYTNYNLDVVGIFENLTCPQVINLGYKLDGDIGGPDGVPDCYVNESDLATMAANWLLCDDLIVGDISGPAGQPDGCVNFYDLAVMADQWLVCNDPQDAIGNCIYPFK